MYEMRYTKADVDRLYVREKECGRGVVQVEETSQTEVMNIAEYLNTIYAEDRFVSIVKSHECNQPNMNSTTKTAEELSQSSKNSDTKKEGI